MVEEASDSRDPVTTGCESVSAVGITAVIPTYNRASLLRRAIASVVGQSWPPSEIVVVDDGSSDETSRLLSELGPAVRTIRTEHKGASEARNEGVRQARSDWIAFLDSDDEWTADHLERISRAIAATGGQATLYFDDTDRCGPTGTRSQWEMAGFTVAGPYECRADGTPWVMATRHPMTIQASVVRRTDILDMGGLWSRLEVREDTHLFFRLGLGRPLCAVAGLGARTSADDTTGGRLTDPSRATTYAHATVDLYRDLLQRPNPTSVQAEFRRRLGEGHWRLSRSAWKAGAPVPALAHAVRSLATNPRAYPVRIRRWVVGRSGRMTEGASVLARGEPARSPAAEGEATVSVLVVSYRTRELLRRCLDSIRAAAELTAIDVVVVDNASGDGSVEMVAQEFPEVKLLALDVNVGFARGTNLAAEHGRGDYLLLLNPDATLEPTTVAELVDFARTHPVAAIVGARTVRSDGSVDPRCCGGTPTPWSLLCFGLGMSTLFRRNRLLDPESLGRWERDSPRTVGYIPGCCLLVDRDRWRQLDGFDTRFFMFGEDIDFALRAARLGWSAMLAPRALATHQFGASFSRLSDKGVLLYAGKATVIRKHWSRSTAWFGLTMLWTGVGLRAAGSRLSGRMTLRHRRPEPVTTAQGDDYWPAVWAQREKWMKGYPSNGAPWSH